MTTGVIALPQTTLDSRDPSVVGVRFRMSPVEKKAADLSAA